MIEARFLVVSLEDSHGLVGDRIRTRNAILSLILHLLSISTLAKQGLLDVDAFELAHPVRAHREFGPSLIS